MNKFAKELKKVMIDNDINQNELAEKCNISKQAISNLFNRDNISLDKMMMLAKGCNCDFDFVFKSLDK